MRLDPRLTWDDIDMRMEYVGARAAYDHTIDKASNNVSKQAVKAKNKFVNALQTRCSRGRAAFTMLSWRERTRKSMPNKTRDDVLKQLSADQIANNTTRGSTPGIIDPLLPDGPDNHVSRPRMQSQSATSEKKQSDVRSNRPLRVLAAGQLGAPLNVPSTHQSRKRKAPAASPTVMAIDNTKGSYDGPLNMQGKRANVDIIDLTQDDETTANSESSAGNNTSTSIPFADLHMYANQQNLLESNRVQQTHPNWPPTDFSTRTPNLSNSFPYYPAPPGLALATIMQPAFGARAHTAQEHAAVSESNWGQGREYYYHNDGSTPFSVDQSGQGYFGWGPTLRVPNSHPF